MSIAMRRLLDLVFRSQVFHSIDDDIRMGLSPLKWTELHDGDETAEVSNLIEHVTALIVVREIKQLCSLIYFCPESMLQNLLRLLECLRVLDRV